MKKIIIMSLMAFSALNAFAQEKKLDANGYEIGKAPATTIQNHSKSIITTNSNLDENGVDKTKPIIPQNAIVQEVQPINTTLTDENGRPTNVAVEEKIYKVKVQEGTSNDNLNYRNRGDIPVNTTNNVKETYIRSSSQDIPVNTTNSVKETYIRKSSIVEPKQEVPQIVVPATKRTKSGNATK
ncbi:MAG: hypothetical protein IPO02_01920 [Bacteroidetes bacterium]|nr:hypothetical protein [Bacteroidota bacterium]